MTDITKTVAPKTDQLNADDLVGGRKMTIKITGVKGSGGKDQPISISFEGDNGKPWKPCLGMRRVLIELWGEDAAKEADKHYRGRMVTLYRDDKVKWAGEEVGGIRISHASHINEEKKLAVTVSKGSRKTVIIKPLKMTAQTTQQTPPPEPEEDETQKPPHVKTAAAIIRKINAFEEESMLDDYMTTDEVIDDLEIIKLASEETRAYVDTVYQAKKKKFQIPE